MPQQSQPGPYQSIPPPPSSFAHPASPPPGPFINPASPPPGAFGHPASPPPGHIDYPASSFTNNLHPGSPPLHALTPPPLGNTPHHDLHTPQSQYGGGVELHDEEDFDAGDIPLLQRNPSNNSPPIPMPGEYDPVTRDDQSDSNIRYGRIPQRVPRRYKTIKKVELVLTHYTSSQRISH